MNDVRELLLFFCVKRRPRVSVRASVYFTEIVPSSSTSTTMLQDLV